VAEVSSATNTSLHGPAEASAFSYVYSDSGLIGAQIAMDTEDASKAIAAATATIRNASVSEGEVQTAKKGLLLDAYDIVVAGNALSRAEDMGLQVLIVYSSNHG